MRYGQAQRKKVPSLLCNDAWSLKPKAWSQQFCPWWGQNCHLPLCAIHVVQQVPNNSDVGDLCLLNRLVSLQYISSARNAKESQLNYKTPKNTQLQNFKHHGQDSDVQLMREQHHKKKCE